MIQDQQSASRGYFKAMLWGLGRYACLFLLLGLFINSAPFRSDMMKILIGGDITHRPQTQPEGAPGEEKKAAEEPGALGTLGRAFLGVTDSLLRAAATLFVGRPAKEQSGAQAEGEKPAEQVPSPTPTSTPASEPSATPPEEQKSQPEQERNDAGDSQRSTVRRQEDEPAENSVKSRTMERFGKEVEEERQTEEAVRESSLLLR